MMRMLDVAGVPVFADSRASYEADALNGDSDIGKLLPELQGKAAKVIDPHRHRNWPVRLEAKVIWLDRDVTEQAKSQVKLLRSTGFTIPGQAWRAIAKSLPPDRTTCLEMFRKMGAEVLRVRFEELLGAPLPTAEMVASVLGLEPPAAERMAAVIISRSPMCAMDMSIEIAAMEREDAELKRG